MPREIPLATYRLQLTKDFGFDDAAILVPYLRELGITHLYASPFLKARAGSTHGYDIVDHAQLNPEFGGEKGFEHLSGALAAADMGLILDFVPNHMGVGRADNQWWLDVLEWGERSPYARSFDIDWETLPFKQEGGVLLPILGRLYGDALEAGEIKLAYDPGEGSFSAWYYEHRLPIRPERYGDILRTVVASAQASDEPAGQRLLELSARYPGPRDPAPDEAPAYKAAIAAVEGGAEVIERGLSAYRPTPDDNGPVMALHRLLERQHYRVAHWRVAVSEINYRRFFDVNDLAGIRVEDLHTFTNVHRLVVRLIAEGRLHGLRLDHIDGLRNPAQYARRLQKLIRRTRGESRAFYTLIEKILGEGESLPQLPGVAGTTGYEWLNVISRVLVDPRGRARLEKTARALTGNTVPFEEILQQSKRRVLETMLASEFTVLARLLARIAAGHWRTRDYPLDRLRAALQAYVQHFPVYRTYVTSDGPSPADRAMIEKTIAEARSHWFGPDAEIFDFLQAALTMDLVAPGRQGYSKPRVRRFALKVQQFTGPMMAKSLEDTAFYRYVPLLALNEVGGDPTAPELSANDFHSLMIGRARISPHGLTATATHDTKRGEDARARILALSELASEWTDHVRRWAKMNAGLMNNHGSRRAPSRTHEYMLYQTLIGAWPLSGVDESLVQRIEGYAIKAAREGKLDTSWMNPNEPYEAALLDFVRAALDESRSASFLESLSAFAQRTALLGALNGLAQLALKTMMPGVPDFYQGTEFWDLSLVDPDNRRPVDFPARAAALAELGENADWQELARSWPDGRIKLALTHRLLQIRASFPALFTDGGYRPLAVEGADSDRLIAFQRTSGREAVVAIIGRHFGAKTDAGRRWIMGGDWDANIELAGLKDARSLLQGGAALPGNRIAVKQLFDPLPVAVLHATAAVAPRERPQRRGTEAKPEPAGLLAS